MPTFQIEHEGSTYNVDAADHQSALNAFQPIHGTNAAMQAGVHEPPTGAEGISQLKGLGIEAARGVPIAGGFLETGGYLPNNEKFQKEHPGLTIGAQVAGGAAGEAPLMTAFPRAFGLTGSLGEKVVRGAISGGAIGGADAYSRGKDPIVGAGIGAGAGLVGPAVGAGVGKVVGAGADALTAPPVPDALKGLSPEAQRIFSATARRDFSNPETRSAVGEMHPDQFAYEAGPNFNELAGNIAQNAGEGQNVIRGAISKRASGSIGAAEGVLDTAMGPRANIPQLTANMEAARKSASDPAYNTYRSASIPLTDELKTLMENPYVKKAMPSAREFAAAERQPVTDASGNLTAGSWDYVKRALYDMESSARRGGDNNKARLISNTRQDVVDGVDSYFSSHPNPNLRNAYQQARRSYAEPSEMLDALEAGHGAFDRGYSKDQLEMDFNRLSGPAKYSYLQSVRASISDALRNGGMTREEKMLLTDDGQAKLRTLLGDRAEPVIEQLRAHSGQRASDQAVIGNSATAPRQFVEKATQSAVEPKGVVGLALRYGRDLDLTKPETYVGYGEKALEADKEKQLEAARDQLAPLMTKQGQDRVNFLADAVKTYGKPLLSETLNPIAKKIGQILTLGPGAQQARNQVQ